MAVPTQRKSRQYHPLGSHGGGGGLGSALGLLFGVPPVLEGADAAVDVGNQVALEGAGEENAAGLVDSTMANNPKMPTVQKPGFFQNLLTRGQAGQQYSALTNQLQMEQYDNALKNQLLQQHLRGSMANKEAELGLKNQFDTQQEVTKNNFARSLQEQRQRDLENEIAIKAGFPSADAYKQILSSPDLMTAGLKDLYSQREKQGFENQLTQAKTTDTNAQARARAYIPVGPNSQFNIDTRELIGYEKPEEIMPEFRGGYSNTILGEPSAKPTGFDTLPDGSMVRPVPRQQPQIAQPVTGNAGGESVVNAINNYVGPVPSLVAGGLKSIAPAMSGSLPFIPNPPKLDLGSVTEPLKNFIGSVMFGNSQQPVAPTQQQTPETTTPSLQPIVQPPSILEQMRKKRQLIFPQPIPLSY